jgi:D-alanine transfer protein
MRPIHLIAALVAFLVAGAVAVAGVFYAQTVERQYVHALAPQILPLNITGSALQKEAFRQPDLLPIYASSEFAFFPDEYEKYTTQARFAAYPTGFAPFEVSKGGVTALIMAQSIAAIGPDLAGKKVVISFAPGVFFDPMIEEEDYAGLFSQLHANRLIFSPQLSFATRQMAARRMQAYPTTLQADPVLHFALTMLDGGSWLHRLLYAVVWPLGRLHILATELQDHWETLAVIWSQPQLNPQVSRQPATLDWETLMAQAQQEQEANANNNPFGMDNTLWIERNRERVEQRTNTMTDESAIAQLQQSAEWIDLEILLRVLQELGAQPLILSMPYNGAYYDVVGVSRQGRQVYYDKLNALVGQYGMRLVDFQEHDEDKYFTIDGSSHLSRKGWTYVNKAIDDFYHEPGGQSVD